jgi:hypothetical protein
MQYYQLDPNILRHNLSANTYFAVEDDGSEHTEVVVSISTLVPWGHINTYDGPIEKTDCWKITKQQYDERYEYVIDLNAGIFNP